MVTNYPKIFVAVSIVVVIVCLAACETFRRSENQGSKTSGNSNTDPATSFQKIAAPVKFLLVGDSLMREGFGPALETSLRAYKDVNLVREGVYSTGLNKTDYFDWVAKTEELIGLNKPDVLVVMFGANDGQGILDDDGKAHELGTDGWRDVYTQRVDRYLTRIAPRVKKLYWVGHPIPGSDKFMRKFSVMNPIYQSEIAKFPNAVYVDTWDRFAVNGVYKRSLPDENGHPQVARQGDGVHVTNFGGKIMAGLVINAILQNVDVKQ